VDNFYMQYDALIDLYHKKFAEPGLQLMALARPLMRPAEFSNKLDFTWYELWHHEGRRARMGVSMMGPDYTHWHGTYEVAKRFYAEFVPELEELIHEGKGSQEPDKVAAAKALEHKLREVLDSPNHQWFNNKMDPAELERRKRAAEEFNARYKG
jgi:hypothetical protein